MNDDQPILNSKKYFLQKIAKVMSMISLAIALCTGMYLFLLVEDETLKLTLGVVAFFFATVGAVFYTIAVVNLPDLSMAPKK